MTTKVARTSARKPRGSRATEAIALEAPNTSKPVQKMTELELMSALRDAAFEADRFATELSRRSKSAGDAITACTPFFHGASPAKVATGVAELAHVTKAMNWLVRPLFFAASEAELNGAVKSIETFMVWARPYLNPERRKGGAWSFPGLGDVPNIDRKDLRRRLERIALTSLLGGSKDRNGRKPLAISALPLTRDERQTLSLIKSEEARLRWLYRYAWQSADVENLAECVGRVLRRDGHLLDREAPPNLVTRLRDEIIRQRNTDKTGVEDFIGALYKAYGVDNARDAARGK